MLSKELQGIADWLAQHHTLNYVELRAAETVLRRAVEDAKALESHTVPGAARRVGEGDGVVILEAWRRRREDRRYAEARRGEPA